MVPAFGGPNPSIPAIRQAHGLQPLGANSYELFECPEPVEGRYNKNMYYLYILRNKFGKFYIGQTNNIQRRLQDHGNKNGAKLVKDNGDFELIIYRDQIPPPCY